MPRQFRWYVGGVLLFAIGIPLVWIRSANWPSADASTTTERPVNDHSAGDQRDAGAGVGPIRVEAAQPKKGGIQRTSRQIGSVIAFESARLFPKVSGYLKSESVDIGSKVHRGQILAEIDTPEALKEVDQAKAAREQAKAQVLQADARVITAKADREARLAAIEMAEADVDKTKAFRAFREKQYRRFDELLKLKSIDERVVDEKLDEFETARAAERLARASVSNARALAAAADARIEQAKADAVDARAKVEVATAALEKAQVLAAYLQITSPYDGVITQRGFFRGDFIRSADQNSQIPLFTVDRTDVMRVVVQIPDRDVPYTRAGNPAVVEIDTVPGIQFPGVVSRTADAEDQETRLMRAEIDLPNDKQLLRQGMYGIATIQLGTLAEAVRIPSSALVGEVKEHNGQVYVVKDGAVHLAPVRVGADDGVEMEVLRGLSLNDLVVSHPSGALYDGAKVSVSGPAPAAPTRSAKTE